MAISTTVKYKPTPTGMANGLNVKAPAPAMPKPTGITAMRPGVSTNAPPPTGLPNIHYTPPPTGNPNLNRPPVTGITPPPQGNPNINPPPVAAHPPPQIGPTPNPSPVPPTLGGGWGDRGTDNNPHVVPPPQGQPNINRPPVPPGIVPPPQGQPNINPNPNPVVPPPQGQPNINPAQPGTLEYTRQHETLAERAARFQAQIDSGDTNPWWTEQLARVNAQMGRGMVNPKNTLLTPPTGTPPPTGNPNINPGGTPPVQLDNDPSTWTNAQRAELAPPVGTNTRFTDTGTSPALKAYKQGIKNAPPPTKTAAKKTTTKPTGAGAVPTTATKPLTAAQKKKALATRPQPGSPQRPYITHRTTYNPLGEGGKLRV